MGALRRRNWGGRRRVAGEGGADSCRWKNRSAVHFFLPGDCDGRLVRRLWARGGSGSAERRGGGLVLHSAGSYFDGQHARRRGCFGGVPGFLLVHHWGDGSDASRQRTRAGGTDGARTAGSRGG